MLFDRFGGTVERTLLVFNPVTCWGFSKSMARTRKSLHEKIASDIGRRILLGEFREGDILPTEAVLTEKYGVSRTAVREAFRILAAKGLTLSRPKVGTRVRLQSDWNMMDQDVLAWAMNENRNPRLFKTFMECRRGIEPEAAALAAVRGGSHDIEQLSRQIDDLARSGADAARLRVADMAFHRGVLAASRNPVMLSFSSVIEASIALGQPYQAEVILRVGNGSNPVRDLLDLNKRVYEAIAARDGNVAREAMTRLIDWLIAFEWSETAEPMAYRSVGAA